MKTLKYCSIVLADHKTHNTMKSEKIPYFHYTEKILIDEPIELLLQAYVVNGRNGPSAGRAHYPGESEWSHHNKG